LKKVVEKYALASFNSRGELDTKKAERFVRDLKSLSAPQAIAALSEFVKRIKTEVGKTALEITSAVPLSSTQVNEVTKAVKVKHNVNAVQAGVDGKLLGGVRVKIGDLVYDNSLAQKIAALKTQLYERFN